MRRFRQSKSLVLAMLIVMAAWAPTIDAAPGGPAAPPKGYEVTALGTLGGSTSFALDVNNHRQVTGNASTSEAILPLNAFL